MSDLEANLQEQLQGYQGKIGSLGEYEKVYMDYAFQQLEGKEMTGRERLVLELVKRHAESFADQRRADGEAWLQEYRKRFAEFSDS